MKKWLKLTIICLCSLLVLAGAATAYYFGFMHPYRGTVSNGNYDEALPLDTILTREQAQEDLAFLMEQLESRHPAWLEEDSGIPQAVQTQLEAELNTLGEEVSILELVQAASRITSVMHDGHTWVRYIGEERYVDDLTLFIDAENTVKAINGESPDDLYARFLGLFQYELEPYASQIFSQVLIRESYLRLMGVDTSEGVSFTFKKNGEQFEQHYNFVPAEEIKGNNSGIEEDNWVSYELDAEHDTAVFTLKSCIFNDEYCAVVKEFFDAVAENNISNIIVDLRGNGGGNSLVANEFLRYIDIDEYKGWHSDVRFGWYVIRNRDAVYKNNRLGEGFEGNIYVLTDTETFSSGMSFAMFIGDNDLGEIIGEASGNRPDAYGDILYFQMPNSRLGMGVSFKRWYRIDQSKEWQPLEPDYPTAAEDALERAYQLISEE